MTKKEKKQKEFTLLGSIVEKYPLEPDRNILETFPNKYPENNYIIEFYQEGEFTSFCPVTGQPDFADIKIQYMPHKHLIEAKSLKIYLMSYRNKSEFGEFITNAIMEDIWEVCKPRWIEITGSFKPRGGISWKATVTRGSLES